MLDKIVLLRTSNEMVFVFTDRVPFILRSDVCVLALYDWFMAPSGWGSLTEYNRAVISADEDTQIIEIPQEEAA